MKSVYYVLELLSQTSSLIKPPVLQSGTKDIFQLPLVLRPSGDVPTTNEGFSVSSIENCDRYICTGKSSSLHSGEHSIECRSSNVLQSSTACEEYIFTTNEGFRRSEVEVKPHFPDIATENWKIAGHSKNDRQLKILRSATEENEGFHSGNCEGEFNELTETVSNTILNLS
jgi:hypothetical protein